MKKNIILSAFNVHIGGGFILLKDLLRVKQIKQYILDERIKDRKWNIKNNYFIKKNILSRILIFHKILYKFKNNSYLLCFNNLPPLLKQNYRVILFVQSIFFFSNISNLNLNFYTTSRIIFEKAWFRLGISNVDEIWVQTPTMEKKLRKYLRKINYKKKIIIKVLLLSDRKLLNIFNSKKKFRKKNNAKNSFFYPADGLGHKNHDKLIKAFSEIKKPFKLYLTLDDKIFSNLIRQNKIKSIEKFINLKTLKREEVFKVFKNKIDVLIFPSLDESFGIPLLEACAFNKFILVSNKNYAHDLIENAVLFDPENVISIKNAINKYINNKIKTKPYIKKNLKLLSAEKFINNIN